MTTAAYQIVKKALLKKRAKVTASPAAAKRFLMNSGLWDVLENIPTPIKKEKAITTTAKKPGVKKAV